MTDWQNAQVVQPEEMGTRAKCMAPACRDKPPQVIDFTGALDGWRCYWLACGHLAYKEESPGPKTRN